ncbi:hypothetical protein J3Q64DRAFT_1101419 [Phycomyces blakesleeanus]|uniref:Retrotransposon gag domain-containing protein n=1 Tax=Phycomyces blakesleeanus TaxID=4837 RepID=A0ABR3B054_PHYBL
MEHCTEQMERIHSILKVTENISPINTTGNNISVCDIPLFQIIGYSVPDQNSKVYSNVEHYLSAFEKLMTIGCEHIDSAWSRWLPIAMTHEYDTWYLENLSNKNLTWAKARAIIKKYYNTEEYQCIMATEALAMYMGPNETIQDYGQRFQRACREGNIGQDGLISIRFLSSLTPALSHATFSAWFTHNNKEPDSV